MLETYYAHEGFECGAVPAIKAAIADVLILKDLDRATRDAYDGLALQREAKAEG